MDRRSMEKLKLDRRLIRRKGWISTEELDKALGDLPDVAHKAAELESDSPETPAAQD